MTIRLFVLSVLLLVVAACNRNPLEVIVSRCPAVAVVGDLGTFTKFEGSGQTTDDVAFTASIHQIQSDCDEGSSVVGQTSFEISAQSGPALKNRSLTLPYFVAVLKDNSQIVSKKIFETTLVFDENGYAVSREVVGQFIPTIDQTRRYNYEVLLGFQIDPQDVVFNLQR
ncbi:hypothetical protein [Kordiimonas sp. SCSIO 12610]|uniref:hypothetical protein n=1 Tax=Kordiimonas sp. SCSIO 12610 TaxID=2829597 RepID=UPI00210D0E5D|nr:hypothetical protein [Kordiimonas sp. SCSIO 12610]UTW54895.1 hypothetical protein KFF44_13955 [Kordiimonas sp. SCSIO 12610]